MFLESKLEKFLTKRVIVFTVILGVADVVCINDKWFALCGLIIGATVSVMIQFVNISLILSPMAPSSPLPALSRIPS